MDFWKKVLCALAACRRLCYTVASATGARPWLDGWTRLGVNVVKRWRLFRAARKRPKVTRRWVGHVRLDLEYDPRHGYRLVGWAVMEVRGKVRGVYHTWEFPMPKKPVASAPGADAPRQAAGRPKVLERSPTLASYLLDLQYEEGGGPREPSYLIIKAAGGEWLATLKDPTEAKQLRVRVNDLGTLYAALEALLAADSCPWEPDVWAQGRKPPSRKRGS